MDINYISDTLRKDSIITEILTLDIDLKKKNQYLQVWQKIKSDSMMLFRK